MLIQNTGAARSRHHRQVLMTKGAKHAQGLEGRKDVHGDEGQGNGHRQSGADRAVENGAGAGDRQATEVVPGGAREAPYREAYLTVNEDGMKAALIEARGDIFVASQLLGITALRLNRAIQLSGVLQTTLDTTATAHKGLSKEALSEAIDQRLGLYR